MGLRRTGRAVEGGSPQLGNQGAVAQDLWGEVRAWMGQGLQEETDGDRQSWGRGMEPRAVIAGGSDWD